MEKKNIDELRGKVLCVSLLEKAGWKVDLKESTRKAVKYRHGEGQIVIVIHDGRGWFDPMSEAKGDVFDRLLNQVIGNSSGFGEIPPSWRARPRFEAGVPTMREQRDRLGPRRTFPSRLRRREANKIGDLL